jgi:hypothetical protein
LRKFDLLKRNISLCEDSPVQTSPGDERDRSFAQNDPFEVGPGSSRHSPRHNPNNIFLQCTIRKDNLLACRNAEGVSDLENPSCRSLVSYDSQDK